jgi:hypothetical protein
LPARGKKVLADTVRVSIKVDTLFGVRVKIRPCVKDPRFEILLMEEGRIDECSSLIGVSLRLEF